VRPLDRSRSEREKEVMGDPLDFVDEGGWPYPDDVVDMRAPEPVDRRDEADDDLVALHALTPRALASLTDDERAAVTARFGLNGDPPCSMVELRTSLGLSRDRTRVALARGIAKLREVLSDERTDGLP
jgi:DNA-directed RNA polymerase sigma subunit (sigma70/sigma32)